MRTTYHGSTREELGQLPIRNRMVGLAAQSRLFAHHGEVRLASESLIFDDWMTISPGDVRSIDLGFTENYTRQMAGGARGGFPSFGFFERFGAPIAMRLPDVTIVVIFDLTRWSGKTADREWFTRLTKWKGAARAGN